MFQFKAFHFHRLNANQMSRRELNLSTKQRDLKTQLFYLLFKVLSLVIRENSFMSFYGRQGSTLFFIFMTSDKVVCVVLRLAPATQPKVHQRSIFSVYCMQTSKWCDSCFKSHSPVNCNLIDSSLGLFRRWHEIFMMFQILEIDPWKKWDWSTMGNEVALDEFDILFEL